MSLLFAQILPYLSFTIRYVVTNWVYMHVFDSAMQNPKDFLFPRAICNFNDNHI